MIAKQMKKRYLVSIGLVGLILLTGVAGSLTPFLTQKAEAAGYCSGKSPFCLDVELTGKIPSGVAVTAYRSNVKVSNVSTNTFTLQKKSGNVYAVDNSC